MAAVTGEARAPMSGAAPSAREKADMVAPRSQGGSAQVGVPAPIQRSARAQAQQRSERCFNQRGGPEAGGPRAETAGLSLSELTGRSQATTGGAG